MMLKDFKKDLNFLTADLVSIVSQFRLYKEWFASDTERITLMNEIAPTVFAKLQRALVADIVVGIFRLAGSATTGKGTSAKENLVLKSLRKEEGYDPSIFMKFEKVSYCELLDKLDGALDPLRDLRNKSIAHSDALEATLAKKHPVVQVSEIERVICLMTQALAIAHRSVHGTEYVFKARESLKDEVHLLDLLRIGHHVKKEEDTAESKTESFPYERCYPKTPDWL